MAFGLPLPRRSLTLLGMVATFVLFLHTFAPAALPPVLTPSYPHHEPDAALWSLAKWTPPVLNKNRPGAPPIEFDEDGMCYFVSVVDALSPTEKDIALNLRLVESSPGIVGVNNKTGDPATEGAHPILGLLAEGERKWNALYASQSRSIEQAYNAYVTKWGRKPPKGFDDWWHFATDREVLMIDEIMESLLPFYGLSVEELKKRNADVEHVPETYTLIVLNGKVEMQWNDPYARDKWRSSRSRADGQVNLMDDFLHLMPDIRATFSIHDQPSIMMNYNRLRELRAAAKAHTVLDKTPEPDSAKFNVLEACPRDSPLVKLKADQSSADTFISRQALAMNPCQHPSLLDNHGMFLEERVGPDAHPPAHTALLPIFSQARTVLNSDIPATPAHIEGDADDMVGFVPAWNGKSGKVYWRGASTGMGHNKKTGTRWRQSHRERLHHLANDASGGEQDVLVAVGSTGKSKMERYALSKLGEYYMDVKLAGPPVQCDVQDGSCDEMREEIDFAPKDPKDKANKYKYVLDTDGNGWSQRFARLMRTNSLTIKATLFPEWNSAVLPEWYAYVPTKIDYSDLYSILAFFRGTPSGRGSHDEVARRIAHNGQCWIERTWRREDLQVYMFRMYLEWARLLSPDRDTGKMDFELQDWHRDPPPPSHNGPEEVASELAMPGIDS